MAISKIIKTKTEINNTLKLNRIKAGWQKYNKITKIKMKTENKSKYKILLNNII